VVLDTWGHGFVPLTIKARRMCQRPIAQFPVLASVVKLRSGVVLFTVRQAVTGRGGRW